MQMTVSWMGVLITWREERLCSSARLNQWAKVNCMRFNKPIANCQVLPWGHKNPIQCYRFGEAWLERCPLEKDWGSWLTAAELEPVSAWVAKKVNGSMASRTRQ